MFQLSQNNNNNNKTQCFKGRMGLIFSQKIK